MVVGAFLASILSGQFYIFWVPVMWDASFGYNHVPLIIVGLAGGIRFGLGTQWACGCTSGPGIKGSPQISLANMILACCFFAGGIATTLLIFRVIET